MNILSKHGILPDERVLFVDPILSEETDIDWRRRLNLFTGRTLSDTALTTEQDGKAGHLATRGQMVSPGVCSGLEIDIAAESFTDPTTGKAATRYAYHILAGRGLAVSGEDVVVPQALHVAALDLPVYARSSLLGGAEKSPPTPPAGGVPGTLAVREIGPALGQLISQSIALPHVGILVLRPILFDEIGAFDPEDPCAIDPQQDAFADQTRLDGAQLLFYAWPDEWLALPVDGPAYRNQIAVTIFNAENRLGPDQALPWEEVGVPIGLVVFDTDWHAAPRFVDRFSVVRSGGKAPRRTPVAGLPGSPFLWEARLQQFAEQVAETDWSDITKAALAFKTLPPAGLLPRSIADPRKGTQTFFPGTMAVDAVPVPLEQLDLALAGSASLAPVDLSVPDQVRLLVPVPQIHFEPDLLQVATVDPLFQQAIDAFVAIRTELLLRRLNVRGKFQMLSQAITGQPYLFPAPDPEQQSDETPLDPSQGVTADLLPIAQGFVQHSFTGAKPPMAVAAGDTLFAYVYIDESNPPAEVMLQWTDGTTFAQSVYWGDDRIDPSHAGTARHSMGPLPQTGTWLRLEVPASLIGMEGKSVTGIAFSLYNGRAAWRRVGRLATGKTNVADEAVWFDMAAPGGSTLSPSPWNFVNFPEAIEADFGTQLRDGALQVTDLQGPSPVGLLAKYASPGVLADEFTPNLDPTATAFKGLRAFIPWLQAKADAADDSINIGFLRVQTDIYRHRQLMLGNGDATRLAISPALATIAQGDTATATEQQINTFYSNLAATQIPPPDQTTANTAAPAPEAAAGATTFRSNVISASTVVNRLPVSQKVAAGTIDGLRSPAVLARSQSTVELVQKAFGATTTSTDITGQGALVGKTIERTTTIAERIATAKAPEAKNFTLSNKFTVVQSLTALDFKVDDIQVPGLLTLDATGKPTFDKNGQPVRGLTQTIGQLRSNLSTILNDADPNQPDEAAYFVSGVELMDHTIAILRQMEGRVELYRQAISDCQQALSDITAQRDAASSRLQALDNQIADARHNVSLARALLAEEQARIAGINAQRDQVINTYVTFLAYYRPRITSILTSVPSRSIDPDVPEDTVPTCLAENVTLPAELSTLVNLMREMPLRWFVKLPPLLDWLDTLPKLQETLSYARTRAVSQINTASLTQPLALSPGTQTVALQRVFAANQQSAAQQRLQMAHTDTSVFAGMAWTQAREQARLLLSPGDLWGGYLARGVVAREVTLELDQIGKVAGCLYAAFAAVEPRIRLAWAQLLGAYDQSVNLRNLASLPQWTAVGTDSDQGNGQAFLQRRAMQALVDWLFGRIDITDAGAFAFMNDVVRVCLLLASHAPVNRIIAGYVSRPAVVQPNSSIHLAVDVSQIRIGMPVRIMNGTQLVAHAVVEDLGQNEVSARIITAYSPGATLDGQARAQFAASGAFTELPNQSTSTALPPVYSAQQGLLS